MRCATAAPTYRHWQLPLSSAIPTCICRPTVSSSGRCGKNVDFDPSSSDLKMLIGIADEMLKQKNVESVLFTGKRIGEQSNSEKLDWFSDQLRIAPSVPFKQPTKRP